MIVRPWVHPSMQASRAVVVCAGPGGFQFLLKTVGRVREPLAALPPKAFLC